MHATTRALSGMPAPTYVVPHVCVNPVNAIFSAFSELDGGSIQYKLQGIDSDSIIAFPKGRSNNEAKITMHTDRTTVPPGLFATPWDTEHAVVSHGYIIWRQMKKLKADYKGRYCRVCTIKRERGKVYAFVIHANYYGILTSSQCRTYPSRNIRPMSHWRGCDRAACLARNCFLRRQYNSRDYCKIREIL